MGWLSDPLNGCSKWPPTIGASSWVMDWITWMILFLLLHGLGLGRSPTYWSLCNNSLVAHCPALWLQWNTFYSKQLKMLGPNFRVRTLPKSTYVHIEYAWRHDEEDPENKHVMTNKLLQSFEETRDQAPYYMSPIISLSLSDFQGFF